MKFVSWNVNGLRACMSKGFSDYFRAADADFFCLQETKMQPGQAEIPAEGYHLFMNSAEKKGYSGTAIFARQEPLSVSMGIGIETASEGSPAWITACAGRMISAPGSPRWIRISLSSSAGI